MRSRGAMAVSAVCAMIALSGSLCAALGGEGEIAQIKADVREIEARMGETSSMSSLAALAAAVDFQRPEAGKTYRVALGGGTFRDEVAAGIAFTAVRGDWDFSAGVAASGGSEALAKAAVGFSF